MECKATGIRVRGILQSTTKEDNDYILDLTGIYGGFDFILEVYSLPRVMDGRVKVGFDNQKYLFLLSKKIQRVRQKRKHVDIL